MLAASTSCFSVHLQLATVSTEYLAESCALSEMTACWLPAQAILSVHLQLVTVSTEYLAAAHVLSANSAY